MYRAKPQPLLVPPRPKLPLVLYGISILLAASLFYFAGIHCKWHQCEAAVDYPEKNRLYAMYFPIIASPLICLLSTLWLITNIFYTNTPCALAYNCLEMPTAVFSSLLAGISAVIEIHYTYNLQEIFWSQRWAMAAADAVALGTVHAVLAFALQ